MFVGKCIGAHVFNLSVDQSGCELGESCVLFSMLCVGVRDFRLECVCKDDDVCFTFTAAALD